MKTLFLFLLLCPALSAGHSELQKLSADFWAWRIERQPSAGDDIPRVERPADWVPSFSPEDLKADEKARQKFRARLAAISPKTLDRSDQVDWLLVRSAIERVNWELNYLRMPYKNPNFYVHQTLGAMFELLLIQGDWDEARTRQLIRVMDSIPAGLQHARTNLTDAVPQFARIAMGNLRGADTAVKQVTEALIAITPVATHAKLKRAQGPASKALADYDRWLRQNVDAMKGNYIIGRDAYAWFLKNIALIPYSPEELLRQGRQEWDRAVAFEVYEQGRNAGLPELPIYPNARAQIEQEAADEKAIRAFLEEKDIMTVPAWMKHYLNAEFPAHVAPLAHMGVVDDLTGPSRLHENGVSYIPQPRPGMSFFRDACAKDPRPIIVHEGVPGHYYQMVRSWKHENPIRRRYYDSGANEGIGFYVEEMLLNYGLFDNRPKVREIIYRFMRLRALRVEVDIRLALGDMTIAQAGKYLTETVPMDRGTGVDEAGFFASTPGQAITYQIGKTQILHFLADARIRQGDRFNLRHFHDYLMVNGNVPIALQHWEYLNPDEPLPFWDE
ncbi:MAG: DUF885 family protein [Acidobacteriota bacterium]|nr:DUF885 family protein [Acidobacteriota bacterium]